MSRKRGPQHPEVRRRQARRRERCRKQAKGSRLLQSLSVATLLFIAVVMLQMFPLMLREADGTTRGILLFASYSVALFVIIYLMVRVGGMAGGDK